MTLAECDELAPELGARDGFDLACRFASETLPGIFRQDDPVLDLRLAPNHEVQLRRLLDELPAETFRTDDALGWTYQFWQAKRKDEVNKSGVKIGARELPAVTQLFTEDYMVEFLLHNSLGAWWAGKERGRLARDCATELEARQSVALPPRDGLPGIDWTYLRFVERSPAVPAANRGRDARAPFLDPFSAIEVTEHNLPHWQQDETWIFVTWRLADSLPAEKLRQWEEEKDAWIARHPEPWDPATTREFHELFTKRIEDWLDAGHGACILRQPEVRQIVVDALAFFDGRRYELGDWVVMPDHCHVLFRPLSEHRLPDILHSWKSFTAKAVNKLLGRTGPVWQEDYWDRLVRNERHLDACQRYIVENPIKAQLPEGAYQRSPAVPAGNRGRDARAPFTPAAGTFDGWPKRAAEIRFLDPCMGSGHFLVFALPILARLRMEEEGLSAAEAVAAVLRDNLHGLEIDERCTQIAAFNVALTAWKLGGYQPLPALHLACSGLAPNTPEATWVALAGDDDRLQRGMAQLYGLFKDAPVLGSLIDPRSIEGDLIDADFGELQPLLAQALDADRDRDDERRELGVVAQGLAKAAEILAGDYDLVATNVPYLTRGKQSETLKAFCERHFPDAKNDLANVFLERSRGVPPRSRGRDGPAPLGVGASCPGPRGRDARAPVVQVVMPQNWLFLGSYRKQRERLLREARWNLLARLGPGAFETISGEVVNAVLLTLTNTPPDESSLLSGLDVSAPRSVGAKAAGLVGGELVRVGQLGQLGNPDGRIVLDATEGWTLLEMFATSWQGITTGDNPRFTRVFWEMPTKERCWELLQSTGDESNSFCGREQIFLWDQGLGELASSPGARIQGQAAWGQWGIAVRQMRELPVTLNSGSPWDMNAATIIPQDPLHLPALWCYCSSPEFNQAVRRIDQKLNVTNATLVKVPFDLAHWQQVAAERYPEGLPKPYSDDPTQWLFDGHPFQRSGGVPPPIPGRDAPAPVAAPLQVAVARLLGYRWPRQTGSEFPDCPALGPDGLEPHADGDGIVCLPPINKEATAAVRLRALLAAAWSGGVSPPIPGQDAPAPLNEQALLATAGAKSKTLEDWLRDEFFEQHCKLFHNRPFVWHI